MRWEIGFGQLRRMVRTSITGMVLLAIATACAGHPNSVARITIRNSPATSDQPASTITIDSQVGETLTPDATVPTQLTADQAWAHFAGNVDATVPPDTTAQLGLLTLPLGPGFPNQYKYQNQPVWAFSWYQCPVNPGGIPLSPNVTCTSWLFVDATTGAELDSTNQQ